MISKIPTRITTSFFIAAFCVLLSAGQSAFAISCDASISVHCGDAPSATFDDNGRLWVAFVHDEHVYVSYSDNDGSTYSSAVQVNTVAEDTEYNGENRPKILTRDGKTIFLSWTVKTSPKFTGEIRFARSTDGGRSFDVPRTINDDEMFTGHRFESMYLTASGNLYITWIDKRDLEASLERNEDYVGAAIYYAVSIDSGDSFSTNYRVSNNSCECCRIAVAPSGSDKIAILWRQVFGEDVRDHAFAVLGTDGTVESKHRATYDEWHINACPHHGPTMVVEPGTTDYHIAWFSNGDVNQGIHYGRHSQATQQTSQVLSIDNTPGAGHPYLASFKGKLYLVWKGFNGSHSTVQLMVSDDGGKNWSEPRPLFSTDQASDHPLLVTSAKGVFLSWHSQELGYQFEDISNGS